MLAHTNSQPQATISNSEQQNCIRIVLKQPKQTMCMKPAKTEVKPQAEKPSYDFVGIAG